MSEVSYLVGNVLLIMFYPCRTRETKEYTLYLHVLKFINDFVGVIENMSSFVFGF